MLDDSEVIEILRMKYGDDAVQGRPFFNGNKKCVRIRGLPVRYGEAYDEAAGAGAFQEAMVVSVDDQIRHAMAHDHPYMVLRLDGSAGAFRRELLPERDAGMKVARYDLRCPSRDALPANTDLHGGLLEGRQRLLELYLKTDGGLRI